MLLGWTFDHKFAWLNLDIRLNERGERHLPLNVHGPVHGLEYHLPNRQRLLVTFQILRGVIIRRIDCLVLPHIGRHEIIPGREGWIDEARRLDARLLVAFDGHVGDPDRVH